MNAEVRRIGDRTLALDLPHEPETGFAPAWWDVDLGELEAGDLCGKVHGSSVPVDRVERREDAGDSVRWPVIRGQPPACSQC